MGPKKALLLNRLHIFTLEDALYYLPFRYEDRSHLKNISQLILGMRETFLGKVITRGLTTTKRGKKFFEMLVGDQTGMIRLLWFNFKMAYLEKKFIPGQMVLISGIAVPGYSSRSLEIHHPEIEVFEEGEQDLIHLGRIVPVYPTTEGLSPKSIRTMMKYIIDNYADKLPETLPEYLIQEQNLIPLKRAIKEIHFPAEGTDINQLNYFKTRAQFRLIFEELFLLELGISIRKKGMIQEARKTLYSWQGDLAARLKAGLAFSLTAAQERVLREINQDLTSAHPMNRLLQGDVGSGKTIVAVMAMLTPIESGYQCALMAPTELLAEQHFINLQALLKKIGLKVGLLTGSIKGKGRIEVLNKIKIGEIKVIVGTHALIQEGVEFSSLGLVVIDEQHRFGVRQRLALREKGISPDILVMTATPIPRSLSLTVFGDLDISVIDELPGGRRPIRTEVFYESRRNALYAFLNQEIKQGRQAYVVYPLIAESEKLALKDATKMKDHLQNEIFPHLKIGLMHGRLKTAEKEAIMNDFYQKKIDILVSTTVIEVGIDVPNASVMVIEHAERFGLSQLHQLRGRIGRGEYQSYCILIPCFPMSEEAKKRIGIIRESNDGFLIAEKDLEIRGPGEFFGTRQSGLPELKFANIIRDQRILEATRQRAFNVIKEDPDLALEKNKILKITYEKKWRERIGLAEVG